MTLTNEPFADLTQVAQTARERGDSGSDSVTSESMGKKAAKSAGAEASEGLTPQQRTARLSELENLIAAAQDQASQDGLLPLYNEQALLCFTAKNYAAAVTAWDLSLALQPEQTKIWYNRGLALDRQGSHKLALESYDRVIELDHGDHIAWGNRAIALRKLGRAEEAKEAARIAFELNPTDMVDSFFEQLALKQPLLGVVLKPVQGLVQWLRR